MLRILLALAAMIPALACSAEGPSASSPDAGYCESNGYESPSGGKCPKGTCLAMGTGVPCCGSICPTCKSKGLVSYTSAGTCPAGLCPSADRTPDLACCDTCGPINEAGVDAPGGG